MGKVTIAPISPAIAKTLYDGLAAPELYRYVDERPLPTDELQTRLSFAMHESSQDNGEINGSIAELQLERS